VSRADVGSRRAEATETGCVEGESRGEQGEAPITTIQFETAPSCRFVGTLPFLFLRLGQPKTEQGKYARLSDRNRENRRPAAAQFEVR
jgi:hypothetical protein